MSKKIIVFMICDILLAAAVTFFCILIKNGFAVYITNDLVRKAVNVIFSAIYIIIDLCILFWFFLYWWSDVKWTNIKIKFRKR